MDTPELCKNFYFDKCNKKKILDLINNKKKPVSKGNENNGARSSCSWLPATG